MHYDYISTSSRPTCYFVKEWVTPVLTPEDTELVKTDTIYIVEKIGDKLNLGICTVGREVLAAVDHRVKEGEISLWNKQDTWHYKRRMGGLCSVIPGRVEAISLKDLTEMGSHLKLAACPEDVLKAENSKPGTTTCFKCKGLLRSPWPDIKYCPVCEG